MKNKIPKIGASGILFYSGRFLLAQRHPDDSQGGMWVTPGGGIEFKESVDTAIAREFLEEVHLGVYICSEFITVQERFTDDGHVLMIFKGVYADSSACLRRVKPGEDMVAVDWFTYSELCSMFDKGEVTEMTYKAITAFWEQRIPEYDK